MSEALKQAAAYDLIDRFLRNNLYDDDYAKYSDALEAISQPTPSPQPATGEPVACEGCGDDATHEAGSDETSFPGAYCDNCGPRAAATTPVLEPAQATQAELTDAALIRELVDHIERNTCTHEETHRGGAIWEVCDSCGARWADDEGGKPEFKWPAVVEKARAILSQRPERVLMTDEQIWLLLRDLPTNPGEMPDTWSFAQGVREAEFHHGITSQAKKETP